MAKFNIFISYYYYCYYPRVCPWPRWHMATCSSHRRASIARAWPEHVNMRRSAAVIYLLG